MKTGSLETAAIQHGHIKTVTHLESHDFINGPDALSLRLKASWRHAICNGLLRNGLIDRRHLELDPVVVPVLVGVQ